MTETFKADNRLRNVWHPSPNADLIVTDNGSINVFKGAIKGQVNTGELIEI